MRSTWLLAVAALARILPNGRLIEVAPTHCPAGHRLGRDTVLVGWLPCDCRGVPAKGAPGHRTYLCQARLPDGPMCEQELRRPPCTRGIRAMIARVTGTDVPRRHELIFRGDAARVHALAQMLREAGATEVSYEPSGEARDILSATQDYVVTMSAVGTTAAVKAAVAQFRKRFGDSGASVTDRDAGKGRHDEPEDHA